MTHAPRILIVGGLAENGIGFKTIAEAIHLRNRVLSRLDAAVVLQDPDARRRALTFVFVGGGYAGVEAIAELQDMARDASASIPGLGADELRWVLVEASDRILPEVGAAMGRYTVELLRQRGIDVRLLIDWTLGLFFPREVVSLDALENPRDAFTTASRRAA